MNKHSPNCPNNLRRSQVAIFEKNGVTGMIALACTDTSNVVSTYDPRRANPYVHKVFQTPDAAQLWFGEYVIATVSENFWSLTYNGPRNFG